MTAVITAARRTAIQQDRLPRTTACGEVAIGAPIGPMRALCGSRTGQMTWAAPTAVSAVPTRRD